MKNFIFINILLFTLIFTNSAQNVGVGLANPLYPLDVSGTIRTNSNLYALGSLGIGATSASYKLQITDGSAALFNTSDAKYWVMNYNSTNNYFNIHEDGTPRLVITNGGNVGLGTAAPAYKLDVAGAIRASGNIQSLGDVSVGDALTIKNGAGVAYNPNSGTNMKIIPFTTANFHAVLGAHGSAETSIGLPGGFTSPPNVFVGNINVTGGTLGELNRVILVLWNCTTTACTAKIINTDNAAVDYNITWDCLAVGF